MNLFNLLKREDIYFSLRKKAKKNEIIFQEDEKCLYVCIVKKGEVSISTYSLSGQEIIYNKLVYSDAPLYRGHVVAKKDTERLLFSKEAFLRVLQNNKEFLSAYLSLEANFAKKLNGQIKLLSLSSAEERFMYFLKNQKSIKFKSISSLASTLFLSREVVSRLISKLVKEKKIKREGNMISLLK